MSTNRHEVYRVHREHPDWGSEQIAAHLGCCGAYVRATAKRQGFVLPRQRQGPPRQYSEDEIAALDSAAELRGIPRRVLIRRIVREVVRASLIDAVLDDRSRAA